MKILKKFTCNKLYESNLLTKKNKLFCLSLISINFLVIGFLFFANVSRFKSVSACKRGEQPPEYYKWMEAAKKSNFSAMSMPDFCASILTALPGMIVVVFYFTALYFLALWFLIFRKNGHEIISDPVSISLFVFGVFFLFVPYLYAELIPNM